MIVRSLSLINFRNYEDAKLEFSPQVNCLVGDNGSGKTTVLDAIYYLSFCKSYLNPIDSQNVRYDQGFFVIQSEVELNGEIDKLHCGVKTGQKKQFRRNNKEYQRLADHIGLYPSVMLTPNDIDLIKDGSDVRRKFMDGIISQYDRQYLDAILDYNRALLQRNNLLRYFGENRTYDEDGLAIWDEVLVRHGAYIFEQRNSFVERFVSYFNDVHHAISGGAEKVNLQYTSQLEQGDLTSLLVKSRKKDRQLRRTSAGIHKDDLEFLIDGHPIKKYGSQGQQKTYLIALKLAQYSFIEESTNVKPVLLLDDIFDKIDDKRVAALMELVGKDDFGQIFITDTHEQRIPELFRNAGADLRVFHVDNGNVQSANALIDG